VGGSSKKVTVGYKYYLGMHMVWCHGPVDKLLRVRVDKRDAWKGTGLDGSIAINAEDLFGGESREGGVSGTVDLQMGRPSQGRNSYLQSQLGSQIPAFRGVVGMVLRQCYLGVNPYLKKWDARFQRIHVRQDGQAQWYDEKAEVESYNDVIGAGFMYWRYKVVSLTDSGDYSSPAYDDSGWPNGPAPFGDKPWTGSGSGVPAGWGFSNTPSTVVPQQRKVWLRSTINLSSLPDGGFRFDAFVDNGIEAWVNGSKVITNYDTYGHYFLTTIPSSYFVVGENSIVVCGRDDSGGVRPDNWFYFDLRLRDQERTILDMNPAHIIRECLTDPDWGMGYQESDVDDTSFAAAADTLHAEGMGMSLLWDRQIPIEDFIKEVVRHISASLYVDRTTGKFVLKLMRDDYDFDTIPQIGEDDVVKVENASRPTFGELVNSVTVQYWNGADSESGSITIQDQALIQMQGAVINTTLQYPGFTNPTIAARVGLRNLKAFSTPLLSATIYTNRKGATLNIGDVFRWSWPDLEVEDVVMRVTGLALGDGRNNQVKITAVEDVFALPSAVVVSPPGDGGWTDPSGKPTPVLAQMMTEAPYYELVQTMGQTDADNRLATSPELGYIILSAGRPGAAINAGLLVDSGAGYEEVGTMDFSPHAVLAATLAITTTSVIVLSGTDLDLVEVGRHVQIGSELCRVDSLNHETGLMTIGRGALDTVPAEHPAGEHVFFWDIYQGGDAVEYSSGETVNAKLLPVTGGGRLDAGSATTVSHTLSQRAFRPYAPGNFKMNGAAYPNVVSGTTVDFTWAHRDRKQQTSGAIYDTTDGNIGPEAGTTYNLRVYNDVGTLVEDQSGLSGTSYSWPNPGAGGGGAELAPCDLSFSKVVDVDHFDPLPAALVDHVEAYASDTGQVTHYTLNTAGTYGISGGKFQASYANTSVDKTDIGAINTVSFTMPVIWVEAEVTLTGTATGYSNGGVGIVKDANNFVMAVAQQTQSAVRIEARFGGGSTSFLANVTKTVPSSFKIALAMVVDSFTVYMDTGSGWQYVTGTGISTGTYDFRTTGNLTGWNPGTFSASKDGAVTWAFDNLKAGRHGGVGMRDQTLVTNEDGSPYNPTADTVLFTATLPDARGQAYAGVFELDLTDYSYQQVGAIMVERGGKVYNDLVPHIIYYPSGNRRILIGTWGNGFGGAIDVLHKLETSQELLSGTRVVSGMTQLSLPQSGTSPGTYDQMMVYDSANSRWLIAYSMTQRTDFSGSPFYAAAAYSTDLVTWTAIGTDTSSGYEGTKILLASGQYWIMAGGPAGSGTSSRVFNASMAYQGPLTALFEGGTSTQPHPMVFPHGDKQVLISFDDVRHGSASFTWGNFLVYEAPRYAGDTAFYRVELESERDGIVSYQKHSWRFAVTGGGAGSSAPFDEYTGVFHPVGYVDGVFLAYASGLEGGVFTTRFYSSLDGETFAKVGADVVPAVAVSRNERATAWNSAGTYVGFTSETRFSDPSTWYFYRGTNAAVPSNLGSKFMATHFPVTIGSDGTDFYCLAEGNYVYKSTDDGDTWTLLGQMFGDVPFVLSGSMGINYSSVQLHKTSYGWMCQYGRYVLTTTDSDALVDWVTSLDVQDMFTGPSVDQCTTQNEIILGGGVWRVTARGQVPGYVFQVLESSDEGLTWTSTLETASGASTYNGVYVPDLVGPFYVDGAPVMYRQGGNAGLRWDGSDWAAITCSGVASFELAYPSASNGSVLNVMGNTSDGLRLYFTTDGLAFEQATGLVG